MIKAVVIVVICDNRCGFQEEFDSRHGEKPDPNNWFRDGTQDLCLKCARKRGIRALRENHGPA